MYLVTVTYYSFYKVTTNILLYILLILPDRPLYKLRKNNVAIILKIL